MIFGDKRISEGVVLQIEFHKGTGQDFPFLDSKALAQRAGGNVADNDFDRNDGYFFYDLVNVVDSFDEVRGNAFFGEELEERRADQIVKFAFAFDGIFLQSVECCERVFVLYNTEITSSVS